MDFVRRQLCDDSPRLLTDPAPTPTLPVDLERTYVILWRDRALPPACQRRQMAKLGWCHEVDLDAPHEAFVSHPAELATILNGIASR